MKVYITSCETGEDAWTTQETKLRHLYEQSDKKHRLVCDPDSADIVLIGNVREENWGEKILENELINRYPGKCFSLTDAGAPLTLHHGIYTSSRKTILSIGRVRAGAYTTYPDYYLNPYITTHTVTHENHVDKRYLLSFVGRNSCPLRNTIFRLKFERDDIFIQDSSTAFDAWDLDKTEGRPERQKYYYDVMSSSKFSLCPRGFGTNSIRLFESLQLSVAPIIISDGWIFPKGPKWNDCSIVIKERHVKLLEKIVRSHEGGYKEMGAAARKVWEAYFSNEAYFDYVVKNCIDIMNTQLIPEVVYWKLNPVTIQYRKIRAALKSRIQDFLMSRALGHRREPNRRPGNDA